MGTDIRVLEAVPKDAGAINAVFYDTWLATYVTSKSPLTKEDIDERFRDRVAKKGIVDTEKQFKKLADSKTIFIAKCNDKVIGVCIVENRNQNLLRSLYVLPEWQGQGVGKKLWSRAFAFFNKKKDVYVYVANFNDSAISFYKKLGFEDTGQIHQNERFLFTSGARITEIIMKFKADVV